MLLGEQMTDRNSSVLDALRAAVETGDSRASPLYRWLWSNHDEFACLLERARPNWTELANAFAQNGFTTGKGGPVRAETLRQMWFRIRRRKAGEGKRSEPENATTIAPKIPPKPEPKRNVSSASRVDKPLPASPFKLTGLAGKNGSLEPPVDLSKPIKKG